MIRKKLRRKIKTFQSTFFPLFLGVLFIMIVSFLMISNWEIHKRRIEFNQRVLELKQEIQNLEGRNEQLKAGVSETLESDYTEKILREKGLYKKEGEEVVVILPPEEKEENKEEEKSIWEKILGKIKLRD
jgi:cell division protein FtsB